ncbi:NUDIX hydrolase [Amycolatopsis sp. DG1A-15b]|uniref:NUDIX hydrolase n=1 Tax=Amycolatopsis sp. DG1A-15b TaxID=3052846 RepID=UPI00333F228C
MSRTSGNETRPSVAIIGSFRQHLGEVREAARVFVEAGFTVKSPPMDRVRDGNRGHIVFTSDPIDATDHQIQTETFYKIFSSDFVYVVNPGGYIGRTTSYELGQIHQRGMAVYYAEPPLDLPIDVPADTVVSAQGLVGAIRLQTIAAKPVRRPRVAALPAVDIVILTIRSGELCVLLIKRGKEPYRGKSALPGGFLRPGESLEKAASRELQEETNLNGSFLLKQVHTFSKPERDPRGRIVSTAFLAIAAGLSDVQGASDAARADWVEVDESMWNDPQRLAFDHGEILQRSVEHARTLLEHTTVAADFCPRKFTISDLRRVYEAIWGVRLNPQNFQRRIRDIKGFVVPTHELQDGRQGRPAELFRRGPAQILDPPIIRPRQRQRA